ncbi:DUF294 nucleotidyltransferase-like domain-containing protein, partial [Paracoccus onubensis]
FIATVHPYDSLPQDELARVAGFFGRREYAAGETVYDIDEALPGLFLIESGVVQVRDRNGESVSELGPRNSFGERGLLRAGRAVTSASAVSEAVILVLPRRELLRLMEAHPGFARFFDRGSRAVMRASDAAMMKVGELLSGKPRSCGADMPIIKAAGMMRDARVSSLGIVMDDGRLTGIVTIRDMSNRVVAEGHDPQAPVSEVMTPDPVSLPSSALGLDVLNIMFERGIGHLPVVDDGRFVGMISQTDLTRVQAVSASALLRDIAQAKTVGEMAETTGRIPGLLAQMVRAHQRHEIVTRMITDITDAVTRRLLEMAEARLGPAPAAWAWAACGSQGRQEQTGISDQDNCLILAEASDPADPYFESFARFVCDGLNECGYVYCPGDMMAVNPRWRQPRDVWRGYFRDWIARPDPEAQMLASVMFDLRAIGGDASLLRGLQTETLELAARNSIFVAHMISNALRHRPPLGLIGGFATIRHGAYRDHIDMKLGGVVPVNDLARVYALQGRLTPVNTRARLQDAEAKGIISGSGGRDLIAAYDLIQTARLENQAALILSGRAPDNFLLPADLPDFERSHLRDAFVVVRGMQAAVSHGKGIPG